MKTKESMSLRKWYGSSVRIPGFKSWNFAPFVGSSMGIVRSIVQQYIGDAIRVHFVYGGTAAADQENKLILINEAYLSGEIKGLSLTSDTTITILLGLIVHESAHFAYSPKTLTTFAEYIKKHTKCVFNYTVAATLGNIIEDVYIEAEVDRAVPSLTWMLDNSNAVFFDQFSMESVLSEAAGIEVAPTEIKGVAPVLNVLIYAKTREKVETTPYISDLFSMVRSATEPCTIEDRLHLVLQVYEELMKNVQDNADESEEQELGESKGRSEGFNPSHERGKERVAESGSRVAESVERVARRLEDSKVTMTAEEGAFDNATSLFIEKPLPLGSPLQMDERYARLAEIGRQRAVVNRPYGMDMNRGNNIRKLYRIATDQKIFAQPVSMNNYKPMQVIVLVDCSGSMTATERGGTRLHKALRAALGAAYGLVEARCEVAVYGHTGDVFAGSEVLIYKGKEFNEPVSNLAARLGWLKDNEETQQNRDGYAIRFIAKKFGGANRKRLLIVISDGEPAATHYHGIPAEEHTKGAVDEVRASGVDVLSISITAEANRANNSIYGRQYNVYNESPDVIKDIVQGLILD